MWHYTRCVSRVWIGWIFLSPKSLCQSEVYYYQILTPLSWLSPGSFFLVFCWIRPTPNPAVTFLFCLRSFPLAEPFWAREEYFYPIFPLLRISYAAQGYLMWWQNPLTSSSAIILTEQSWLCFCKTHFDVRGKRLPQGNHHSCSYFCFCNSEGYRF